MLHWIENVQPATKRSYCNTVISLVKPFAFIAQLPSIQIKILQQLF